MPLPALITVREVALFERDVHLRIPFRFGMVTLREAPQMRQDQTVLVNLSGRGDKDIFTIADALGDEKWKEFLRDKAAKL